MKIQTSPRAWTCPPDLAKPEPSQSSLSSELEHLEGMRANMTGTPAYRIDGRFTWTDTARHSGGGIAVTRSAVSLSFRPNFAFLEDFSAEITEATLFSSRCPPGAHRRMFSWISLVAIADAVLRPALWLGIIGLVLLMGVMAAVPPVRSRCPDHHLAVPKLYLQHGGMVHPPHRVLLLPYEPDLLYLLPLYFGKTFSPIHPLCLRAPTAGSFLVIRSGPTTISLALAGPCSSFPAGDRQTLHHRLCGP